MDILNAFWVVNDTNPTTQVFSSASGVEDFIANNDASYQTWLSAGNYGLILTVLGTAVGAAGRVRLQVDAALLQTSQYVYVSGVLGTAEANGFFQFNKIDASHIDLIGTTFANAYVGGGNVTCGEIIATAAALCGAFDAYAQKTYVGSAVPQTVVTANIVLSNPCPDTVFYIQAGAAANTFTMPKALTPRAPPLGHPIYIRLIASGGVAPRYQSIKTFTGGTLAIIDQSADLILRMTANATKGGSWVVDFRSPPSIGHVQGLRGSRTAAKVMTFSFDRATCITFDGRPLTLKAAAGLTCDLNTVGLGGTDTTVVANADTHFYLVARQDGNLGPFIVASAAGPNDLITPTYPSQINQYEYSAYLCSLRTIASKNLPDYTVRGREVFYNDPTTDAVVGTGLTNSNATPNTSRSVTTLVPACASSFRLRLKGSGVSGAFSMLLGINTGVIHHDIPVAASGVAGAEVTMPGATAFFQSNSAGAANTTDIHVLGYSCPSGDT